MIKKTLYFGNPAYLSLKDCQLVIRIPEVEKAPVPEAFKKETVRTIPIEDIGVVVLDNKQITFTQGLMEALLSNNCAVITCNSSRMPYGLLLPLDCNDIQQEKFTNQLSATIPLKKQLWQQTIQAKIYNQAKVLEANGIVSNNMFIWSEKVKSGDSENLEARAAAFYWRNIFPEIPDFTRKRDGIPPNQLLNYGYAILRAVIARALVATGLLPTLGIHHHNKYNAYCLADDIMEPYRPYVDQLVIQLVSSGVSGDELTKEVKSHFLTIPVLDVVINGERRPLMNAATITASSLSKCFSGELRKIVYPIL